MAAGAVAVALLAAPAARSATLPRSMAALGDSFTVALYSGCSPGPICPANSWSTGTNTAVKSHLQRLHALGAQPVARNFAVSGRKVSDLGRQVGQAVSAKSEYVTILIGLNDVCRETEAGMTPVATFRSQFASAMASLAQGLPNTRVFVASIPDPYRYWELFGANSTVRARWTQLDVCRVMLGVGASAAQRGRVRQRAIDFNTALSSVCRQYASCRFDGNAIFNWDFGASHLSSYDYFHPSPAGQARIADITWRVGFFGGSPPPPTASSSYASRVLSHPALLAYWRLGETSGSIADDAKGSRNGTYSGAVTLGSPGALSGDSNTSASFSGGAVRLPDLPGSINFTAEGWMKINQGAATNNGLFGSFGSIRFMPRPSGYFAGIQLGGTEYSLQGTTASNVGAWVHWALVRQGTTMTVYRNGVPVGQRTNLPGTAQAQLDGSIGRIGTSYPASGQIDEIALYTGALSASEVAAHRDLGRG